MDITSIDSTYCFVSRQDELAQVVRVIVTGARPDQELEVSLRGRGLEAIVPWRGLPEPSLAGTATGPAWAPRQDAGLASTSARFTPAPALPEGVVVELTLPAGLDLPPGSEVPVEAVARSGDETARRDGRIVVRRPGRRMLMVAHFHYDPVWWNTQAGYTSGWDEMAWALERREAFQHTGLALVEAHLERARLSPGYKFVLAEVDYLKPFWDLYPDRREELRGLVAAGRVEIVGGTYNEPNTNLTGAETAIRCAVYGMGFQRDVLGASPRSAWQLDVFGHDPQFPGIMADCGVDSSGWARGPFHQWGPKRHAGSNKWMQFPSEFEWIAPNGKGLLTCYMPNHYSAGWELERASTLPGAMWRAYELFEELAQVAATSVTLLPVGTDYTPPSRWIVEVAESWATRYAWPRFEVGLPQEFFAAVREELAATGRRPSVQTRDMNPIYTGKDVSFIDTKQAQRLAEVEIAESEAMSALAALVGAAPTRRALDKAWRQLVFGSHHDGITGSESDQVYLDLLGGWREAYELARSVGERARAELVAAVDTSGEHEAIVVTNTLGSKRSDLVELTLPDGADGHLEVRDGSGRVLPSLVEPNRRGGGESLSFLAPEVPGVGHRTLRLCRTTPSEGHPGWRTATGVVVENEHFRVRADPGRGGGLAAITDICQGFELIPPGQVGNELLVYPEHANHPEFGEGPWHLLPAGPPARSSAAPARIRREVSALGERLVVNGAVEGTSYRQEVTLWHGVRRVELRTELHGWRAADRLVRLRVPTTLAGATPVSAVGDAVVARSYGLIDVDAAEHPWTLDNPAAEWFGLSTTFAVCCRAGDDERTLSVGVAEVVVPAGEDGAAWARELLVALVQQGVTATCSEAGRNRYGGLLGDSNLPDFRIAVGGPDENEFVERLLERAPAHAEWLRERLAGGDGAAVLVPPPPDHPSPFVPGADVRGERCLPVLVVAGAATETTVGAVRALVAQVRTGKVTLEQPAHLLPAARSSVPAWTAALVNRGTPGFAVDPDGALHVSLLRACTGWPSGVWIDPPRRRAPDGSAFELEHWSHVFEHALLLEPGGWRAAGCVEAAQGYNRPLRASLAEARPAPLPGTAALLSLEGGAGSAGRPVLAALKPGGNPLAAGDATPLPIGPGVDLTLRLYEAHGQPVELRVTSAARLLGARRANLLEEAAAELPLGEDGTLPLALEPAELATYRLHLEALVGARAATAEDQEPAQPVFSRYWLHNKGPAPMGNQAVAVHVLTPARTVRAGEPFEVPVQVASSSSREVQEGTVELRVPEGWWLDPPSRLYALAPGAHLRFGATVRVPKECHPGRYFVAAASVDRAGQRQEDVVSVEVLPPLREGDRADAPELLRLPAPLGHPSRDVAAELEAVLSPGRLALGPGEMGELALALRNRTQDSLRGEAQLISPVETWPFVEPWTQAFSVERGDEVGVCAKVRAPAAGYLASWALFKVTYFGRLWYSPPVELVLGAEERDAEGTGG